MESLHILHRSLNFSFFPMEIWLLPALIRLTASLRCLGWRGPEINCTRNEFFILLSCLLTCLSPAFSHIQRFFNDFTHKDLRDTRNSNHYVLRHRTSSDCLHESLHRCLWESGSSVHLISVELLFGEVWNQDAGIGAITLADSFN